MATIEEKAKRYDEVIKKLRGFYRDYDTVSCLIDVKEELANLIPELAESEDERIRNFISNELACLRATDEKGSDRYEELTKAIDWLEKQGEQRETLCDKCKKEQPSHSCQDITALGRCALEKQSEQKPKETKNLETVISNILKCYSHIILHRSLTQDELNETDVYAAENTKKLLCFLEQKPAPWSEEDEENFNWFEKFFRAESVIAEGKDIPQDRYLWFKNLKERVQPKQEWSEEDIIAIDCAVEVLSKDLPSLATSIERLKSLRPQSTWKPSEEQMGALEVAVDGTCIQETLYSLYQDLNKLK